VTSSEDRTPRNGQADAAPLAIPAGALPAGIFFADHPLPALVFERGTLRILEANRAACTLYGYSAEEFRRLTLADIRPPEDVPLLRQFVDGTLPGPPPAFWRHRTRDGRVLQVRIAGQDITYGGRPARITFILEHTPVEEALAAARDAEQRFRSIFDYAGHAIVVFDMDLGRFVEANDDACRLFGLSREQLLQQSPAALSPERQPSGEPSDELARARLERALAGEPMEFEWVHQDAAGRLILCEVRLVRMPPFDRRLIRGAILDIRQRRAAEAELQRREREFRSLAENSPDLIVRFDDDLRIIYANRAALASVGAELRTVAGLRPTQFLPGSPALERWERAVAAVLETRQPLTLEGPSDFRGPGAYSQTHLIPEFDEDGAIASVLSITRDLTEIYRAAAENARLASIVAFSRDAMVTTDLEGRITSWNRGAELALGYTAAEALGRTTEFLFEPEALPVRQWIRSRVLAGENIEDMERPWRRKDGSTVILSSSYFPLRNQSGEVIGIGSVARDVTERVRDRAALAESEARFRNLADSAPIMIWTAGPDRQVDYMSRACFEFTGRGDEILGEGWTELIHPDDLPRVLEEYARGFDQPGFSTLRYRLRHRSGEYRWVVEYSTPRFDEQGGFRGLVGTVIDIHETVLAQEAIERSEARLRDLLDAVSAAVWVSDGRNALFVNAEMERLTGYSRDELLAPGFLASLIAEEDIPVMLRHFERRLQGLEQVSRFTIRISTRSGELRYLRVAASPFQFDGRDVTILSALDTTDLVRAEEERRRLDLQVQQTQKLESLGVLAGGIAHDFNNLLVAILGNAGLALMELPPESPARQTVLAIETAAQRAAELTRQMLAYSGKGKFVIEQLNLSRVVEEMAHLLEISVSKRAVLKYRFAPDLPAIEGDATQLRQVIMNLITNASDAIGDRSGVISVSTGLIDADAAYLKTAYMDDDLPEGQYVYLEVADTGIGMDAETAARIFDPFFTTKFTGRGLGLAAVLGIVRSHRGAIKLSTAPGRGTTFTILFPAAGPPAPPDPAPAPETVSAPLPRAVILVVDDDETVRAVTRRMLELSGFTVLLAADGAEAVALYRERPGIDLVLLDLTMPAMDGEETFRELRRLDPGVRVILTSGYSEQDAADRFAGTGLAGFIQKPYRPQDLIETVRAALQSQA
jgi:two-component system cell cycle sensor histidine kinase/response regulator CckA